MPNSPRLRYAHRDQGQIRCESLDQLLPPDHPVRAVLAFVEGLDLTPLLDGIGALPGVPGAPAFDPRILVSVWLYATLQGIGSSRELADHCADRWLCGDLSISDRTLSGFRTRHGESLNRLLTQTSAALMHQGLVTLQRVAQDGMRVRAAAGASSFHRSATLERCLREATEQVQVLQSRVDEDAGAAHRRAQVAKQRGATERVQRLQAAAAEQKQLGAGRDPFARKKGDTDAVAAWRARMATAEAKQIYKDRASTAEWVNAQVRNRGLYQFTVRGRLKVLAVVLWHALAHNFGRCLALRSAKRPERVKGLPERTES